MKTIVASFVILTGLLTAAAADTMPKIDSEKLCKARSAAERLTKLAQLQSVPDCVKEENDARERLGHLWDTTETKIRKRCRSDAVALGTLNYVDLLTCIQMADDLKAHPPNAKAGPILTPKK
jgi:hypothetical protein